MEKEQEDFLKELLIVQTIGQENPCKMSGSVLKAITTAIKTLVGSHIGTGASREQAARYLERDVRTITRWRELYSDFPKPRHEGYLEISYDWMELVEWKLNHKDLYGEGK